MQNKRLFFSFLFAFLMLVVAGCKKAEVSQAPAPKPEDEDCASKLQTIAQAKKAWAEANSKTADDTPTPADITPYVRRMPTCPGGGTYTIGKVGELPTCSIAAHNEAFKKLLANPNPNP